MRRKTALCLSWMMALSSAAWAGDAPSVSVTGLPVDDRDTTISVRKGSTSLDPDYRIDSGSEELSSEPVSGQQASYASWKKTCTEWKKEMREMNGGSLITLSCGTPHATRDSASLVTQTSTATYKIKVRIRDAKNEGAQGGKTHE